MRRLRKSIRLKLTIATLVPLITAIVLGWVIGASIITDRFFAQAQQNVETDLSSAHELLMGELARLSGTIRLTSQSPELAAMLEEPGAASPAALRGVLHNESLSFLSVTDAAGVVRFRVANPGASGDALGGDRLVSAALKGGVGNSIGILSPEQAGLENPGLPPLMAIRIRPTPRARQQQGLVETRGMFLLAAAPVTGGDGRVVGVVYGGVLLNNAGTLTDRITQVVFRRGKSPDLQAGNATLFLDDVRIATSVLDERGERATGSLMSEEVYTRIRSGQSWAGRAFVLNDWHLAAYEPVRDGSGRVIGALYVGTPERPYLQIRSRFNLIFTGVLICVAVIGIALSAWLGRNLALPVKALEEGARRIAAGENLPDIAVSGSDEIASLAEEFNIMKHRLADREEENLALNRTLEQKVIERTAQLEEKSSQLLAAQKELAEAERLAGIGLLASGVAHEINNPLAVIHGNAELLEMTIGHDRAGREEVETIIRQAERIERIVRNLLAFSRHGLRRVAPFPLPPLLDGILDQIGHQIRLERYVLERPYRARDLTLEGDEDQLRQVFTNLIVNGLQAMEGSGRLTVDAVQDAQQTAVSVADTGPGIPAEHRDKLFTPFFTTKRDGTGLGLAISYGIVRDHGGEIRVASEPGQGTTFTVVLPRTPTPRPAGPAV